MPTEILNKIESVKWKYEKKPKNFLENSRNYCEKKFGENHNYVLFLDGNALPKKDFVEKVINVARFTGAHFVTTFLDVYR